MKKLGYLLLGFVLSLPLGAAALQGVDISPSNTGISDAAWPTYTPSVGCGTATFTVNFAHARQIGKIVLAELDFTITALGTCTNVLTFNAPFTAASSGAMTGRELVNSSKGVACQVITTVFGCAKADATNFAVNDRVVVSGIYEGQ